MQTLYQQSQVKSKIEQIRLKNPERLKFAQAGSEPVIKYSFHRLDVGVMPALSC